MSARKPVKTEAKFDISTMFGLIDEGPATDIARDKDKMIGEAVWQEYLRKTEQVDAAAPSVAPPKARKRARK